MDHNNDIVIDFHFADTLFASTPSVVHALDIGRQAELYTYEHKFSTALDLFKSALSVLLPLLKNESPGTRKELLHKQVH